MTEFDWNARLNGPGAITTDAEWVLDHEEDYPQAAIDAASAFLKRYPSLRAKELAHNFRHIIETYHSNLARGLAVEEFGEQMQAVR